MIGRKNVSDLLAVSLFLIGIWILCSINNWLPIFRVWIGNTGATILIVSQGYFLIKKWFGRSE